MATQRMSLPIKVPKEFRDVDPYKVDCLRLKCTKPKARVMVIIDHIPQEDLRSGALLSGGHGSTLARVMNYCCKAFDCCTSTLDELDILFVNWNCWKTYDMSEARRDESDNVFADRIHDLAAEYGPDYIVTCGPVPFKKLAPKALELSKGEPIGWLGNTLPMEIGGNQVKLIPNLSLNTLLNPKNISTMAYLLGYFARNFLPIFCGGKMPFRIPTIRTGKKRNFNIIVPKTLKEFHAMMKVIRNAPRVAVDTETDGLNRVNVNLLTIQFCADGKNAYVLPFLHNDSPFNKKELEEIRATLQEYFEDKNKNKVQVFVNAKFDLNIIRNCIGVRSFRANVWDCIAGEFVLDENLKIVSSITGHWYYRLANIAMQYGCRAYLTAEFGKENRAMIKDVPLDDKVCEYAALDVVIPWHILEQQQAKAASLGYEKYISVVSEQVSDQIHAFSTLEYTGAATDVDYLFELSLPDSPINKLLYDTVDKFKDMPEVVRADKLLKKRNNIPSEGLLGAVKDRLFKLSVREHLQTLFFDVMKLEPETTSDKVRANGKQEGKIDKAFQAKHESHPVMKMFTSISKLHKLRNAYVKSLIRLFGDNDDFRTTRRLRPTYNYDKIVTGRSSASDPNLQQVPSRGDMAKYIKRLFISTVGHVIFKVDFSAHEVRGWSIISGDKEVAEAFAVGARLRKRYRLVPDKYIAKRLEYEGDVHKINAAFFFGIDILDVVKSIRNAVKTVVFGLIYQQGDEGLARSTGRPVEEIGSIKAQFLGRFPVGYKWFDQMKSFVRKHLYVESPLGRRRNLFAFLLDETLPGARSTISRSERQSVNSPVQGFGSDLMMTAIRLMERRCFDHWKKTGVWPGMRFSVSVHDSLSVEVAYEWFWFASTVIEECMTVAVREEMERRHNMEFTSEPEIDFEIGGAESTVESWDWSFEHALELLKESLIFKRDVLKDATLTDKEIARILDHARHEQYEHMPVWMKEQVWANNIDVRTKGTKNPMDLETRRAAKQYRSEFKANAKALAEILAKEEAAKSKKAA